MHRHPSRPYWKAAAAIDAGRFALLMTTSERAKELGLTPIALILELL
jgi:hypothetical protein